MDFSFKALASWVIIFFGVLLFVSVLTFFVIGNNARSTLYSVVNRLETEGYDIAYINDTASKTNTVISVDQIDVSGVGVNGKKYKVQVTFSHFILAIKLQQSITLTAYSRVVNY